MPAIAITWTDLTAEQLRAPAGREKDSAASRRMLALAQVIEGVDRTNAAKTCGMDRQSLRDWVHRYNSEGLAGLCNRKLSGRPPMLTPDQKAVLGELVEKGPDRRFTRSCAGVAATLAMNTRTALRRQVARAFGRPNRIINDPRLGTGQCLTPLVLHALKAP
jgi:transposase